MRKMYTPNLNKKDFEFVKERIIKIIPDEPIGLSSKDIARDINVNQRDVRCIIQMLRNDGYAICSSPVNGYWYARSSDELYNTFINLESQIRTMKDTQDALMSTYLDMKYKEEHNEH